MNKQDFIRLLEQYKSKALDSLYNEAKVSAALLVPSDLHTVISQYEESAKQANTLLETVSKALENISKVNQLPDKGYFYRSEATTGIGEKLIGTLQTRINYTAAYKEKREEIVNKFDRLIAAAKATKSVKKLKALAESIGIELLEIEVAPAVPPSIDTEFIKEKIQSVLLLT